MSEVRPLAPNVVEQVFDLLGNEALPVQSFSVQYGAFFITADSLRPLDRLNAATWQLRRGAAEAGQWAGRAEVVRVLLRRVGTRLEQAFQYPHGWRDVGYDLAAAWQTDTEALIGFRMVSGSGGRNRWFGRRDGKVETRTAADMEILVEQLRQELRRLFAAQNSATDTGLPGQWLTVARLPLATPTILADPAAAKTQLLRQLSQALVLGEVLRRVSFGPDEEEAAAPPAPAYYLLGAMHQGRADQTSRFVAEGRWENDDPGRYADVLGEVQPGDRVAIKASFAKGTVSMLRVKARGTVQVVEGGGQVLRVAWDAPFPPFDLPGLGSYQRTVHRLTRPEDIAAIFHQAATAPAMPVHPLNQILYGPPGTGKTYGTTAWALALLNPGNLPVAEIQAHYGNNEAAMRQAFEQCRQLGQVGFVSFHQSFSYEDFVEGIKPVLADADEEEGELRYRIEAGIFKRMVERATYALHVQRQLRLAAHGTAARSVALGFDALFALFSTELQGQLATVEPGAVRLQMKNNSQIILKEVSSKGNFIFYHANGSPDSKFTVSKTRFAKLYHAFPTLDSITNIDQDITAAIGGANTSVFWAFFRAFKDFEQEQNQQAASVVVELPDLPTQLRQALTRPELAADVARDFDYGQLTAEDYAQAPRFVLIIDEINRGNVASIFGELISLLEDDKRGGQPHELRLTLPYSKQSFVVPPNLYLLGTMNTADRSVEALDTALRRRFSFHELAPRPDLLRPDVAGVRLPALLTALNERLELLLGRDHRLGHAWLMPVRDLPGLQAAFSQKVIPQLQEYFYGHWGRLGQVLGTGFVRPRPATTALMPGFDGDDEAGAAEATARYEITPAESWTAATFQALY